MKREKYFEELITKILKGEITKESLVKWKAKLAKKYKLKNIPKNADAILYAEKHYPEHLEKLKEILQIKPVRTASGVSVIAVMVLGDCPGTCIYCPRGENAPQSYTGVEPATMRAKRLGYDPYRQVATRLRQLEITGHPTDKCELIIMGGTFLSLPKKFQEKFVKRCFDAFNEKTSRTLKQAHRLNESARHRCVGLTIETRPDYCKKEHINQMLRLGATRVELGVQAIDDEILKIVKRGHDVATTIRATRLAKDASLKICYHLMPGLTGLYGEIDMKKEKRMLKKVFADRNFRPDLLKIYPTLVIPGTKLYEMWKRSEYKPLTLEQTIELILYVKQIVPKWVRIQRVQRDISWKKIVAGPRVTNLRQLVQQIAEKKGIRCRCIRCREVGHRKEKPEKIELQVLRYKASLGEEYFISFEDVRNDILIGYIRLRFPYRVFRPELKNAALVRELHVYGVEVPIGEEAISEEVSNDQKYQHRGYGSTLLRKAEEIALANGFKKLAIISGVGVRNYFRKFGYKLIGPYMIKELK